MRLRAAIGGGLLAVGLLIAGCGQNPEPSAPTGTAAPTHDCPDPPAGAVELRANATPPREIPGGRVALSSATSDSAELLRDPGTPRVISVRVGEMFEIGTVRYRLLAACRVDHAEATPAMPGSTLAIAYIRAE